MLQTIKKREKEFRHQVLLAVNNRLVLSRFDQRRLVNWDKGYDGECRFDNRAAQLHCDGLAINGIYLKVNGSKYQIDVVVIFPKRVVVYEIKNYQGEYLCKNGQMYHLATDREIQNPFHQLEKNQIAVRQILYQCRSKLPVEGYVVFMHPEFTLYNAPYRKELILPTKLDAHFETLNREPGCLNEQHKKLAKKIAGMNILERSYEDLPAYGYDDLKKGIICMSCGSFMEKLNQRQVVCKQCGCIEAMTEALCRMTEEYLLLLPDIPVTTLGLIDFCGNIPSHSQVRAVLDKYGRPIRGRRLTQYEFPNYTVGKKKPELNS